MRFLPLCLAVSLVGFGSIGAQAAARRTDPVDSLTRAQITVARDAVWRAWFAADTASLARLLPVAVAAGSPDGWESRDSTIAASRRFASGNGRLIDIQFDSTTISVRGAVAVVQSRYRLTLDQGGARVERRGAATEIFVHERGAWVNPFWYLQ